LYAQAFKTGPTTTSYSSQRMQELSDTKRKEAMNLHKSDPGWQYSIEGQTKFKEITDSLMNNPIVQEDLRVQGDFKRMQADIVSGKLKGLKLEKAMASYLAYANHDYKKNGEIAEWSYATPQRPDVTKTVNFHSAIIGKNTSFNKKTGETFVPPKILQEQAVICYQGRKDDWDDKWENEVTNKPYYSSDANPDGDILEYVKKHLNQNNGNRAHTVNRNNDRNDPSSNDRYYYENDIWNPHLKNIASVKNGGKRLSSMSDWANIYFTQSNASGSLSKTSYVTLNDGAVIGLMNGDGKTFNPVKINDPLIDSVTRTDLSKDYTKSISAIYKRQIQIGDAGEVKYIMDGDGDVQSYLAVKARIPVSSVAEEGYLDENQMAELQQKEWKLVDNTKKRGDIVMPQYGDSKVPSKYLWKDVYVKFDPERNVGISSYSRANRGTKEASELEQSEYINIQNAEKGVIDALR